jgi:alpha-glucosidase
MEAALPAFAWPNYVLGNHDQPRLATRFGGQAQARLAAMMLLTLRGTPTLYYGDEIGMENGIIPPEKIQDPQGINLGADRTRDVTRTPMQWDGSSQAGFSTVEPWLPVSADFSTQNVASQSQTKTSILNLYRRLLWMRRQSPALHGGTYRPINVDAADCYVYAREMDGEQHIIALNFAAEPRTVSIGNAGTAKILLSTHMDRDENGDLAHISLRAFEGVIIKPE